MILGGMPPVDKVLRAGLGVAWVAMPLKYWYSTKHDLLVLPVKVSHNSDNLTYLWKLDIERTTQMTDIWRHPLPSNGHLLTWKRELRASECSASETVTNNNNYYYYNNKRHIKNIHLHSCKHKTVTLKLTLTLTLTDTGGAVRDPNVRIQKTEDLQIKTKNAKLRLRKI